MLGLRLQTTAEGGSDHGRGWFRSRRGGHQVGLERRAEIPEPGARVLGFAMVGFPVVLPSLPLVLAMAPLEALEVTQVLGGSSGSELDELDILLLPYATLTQPPYLLAGVGLVIGILCGLTFSKLVQQRLEDWKQDRLPLLPLARLQTVLPWIGLLLGITLFIGGSLQVFGFAPGAAILVAFLLSLATGGALWVQLVRLMRQVQEGNFKAVDFDNFDEFFG
jgi:hypothetical protein